MLDQKFHLKYIYQLIMYLLFREHVIKLEMFVFLFPKSTSYVLDKNCYLYIITKIIFDIFKNNYRVYKSN